MKLTKKIRTLAFIMALTFVFLTLPRMTAEVFPNNFQSQIDGINSRLADLEEEKRQIERAIASARTNKEQEQQRRNHIDQQIRITRDEIDAMLESIDILEGQIEFQEVEIATKQLEIDESYDLFLQRIQAMDMYGNSTMLGLVLGSDSFSSFLTQADTMARVAEHDRALMAELALQKANMERVRMEMDLTMIDLQNQREAIEDRRNTLTGQLQAANSRIQDIDEMERAFLADLERNNAMAEAMERELKDIFARIEWSTNPYVGGEMAWPVPGFTRVSSEFGSRFGGRDFHTGIDIAGPGAGGRGIHGATVVAANDGIVRFTNWTFRPGVGYGIYLIIDHGGGVSTLYAHLSNITVSVGDVVARGQEIAAVGSTGWSTGPHLHFEVRHGGVAQNPRPYIFR